MSNIPFRNTDFSNNPIGNDRPIYGNELVPDGGCYPAGYSPKMSVDGGIYNDFDLYRMTEWSGGTLDGAYVDSGFIIDYSNVYRNTELSGITFSVYQGLSRDNYIQPGKSFLIFNTYHNAYLIYQIATTDEFNPVYWSAGSWTNQDGSYLQFLIDYEVINGVAYPKSEAFTYDLSYNCNPITPTPSATSGVFPSPTPTPSPTPAFCVEYVVENTFGFPSGAVYYGCCDTEQTNHPVLPGQTYTFCAREIVQLGALTLVSSGASATCNSEIPCPTPTPTPTPSISPSITPSPTNCNCLEYDVNNNTEFDVDTIGWLDCNQQSQEQSLGPGTILRICACAGSVQSRGGHSTITLVGSCSITPTPTQTPTHTPTPSTTPYAYRYEVSNCDDPLDVRTFWSDDFYPIGKIVKGYNDLDKCFEIVGSSSLTPTDEVAASYISCGSCPR